MLTCTRDPAQKSCSAAGFISCGLTSYPLSVFRLTGFVHRSETCCRRSLNAVHIVYSFMWIVLIVVMCVMLHYRILYIYVCMYCMRFNCWGFCMVTFVFTQCLVYLFAYCKKLFQSSDWKEWGELPAAGSDVSEVLIKYSDPKHCLIFFFSSLNVFFILILQVATSAAIILHI